MKPKHARTATRARLVAVATGLAVLSLSSSAYAYWRTTGSGTDSATAGAISLTSTATVASGQLIPGGSVNVTVNVTNPSSSTTLQIVSIPASFSVNTSPAPKGACGVTKVHWIAPTLPVTVSADGVAVPFIATVSMDSDVEDGCQSAAFTATITVNGKLG